MPESFLMATGLVSGKLTTFFRWNVWFKLNFNLRVMWYASLQFLYRLLAGLSRLYLTSNDRLCSTMFFSAVTLVVFGDNKPTRQQFCVSKQVLHSVKSALNRVKLSLKGFLGFLCHSFWTGQRGCVMPQLVDILLFTVLDSTASGFELRILLQLLRSGKTAGPSFKMFVWTL